jgi:hypothetical protein
MKEYIVYNNNDNFFPLENLVSSDKEPTVFNSYVRIKKYKITIEEIPEPLEVLKERLKDFYKKETNWHNKEALNGYSQKLFGINVSELDEESSEEKKLKAIKNIVDKTIENETIDLSLFEWRFRTLKFDYNKPKNWYSYVAYYRQQRGYYTPMRNTSYILTFKTLAGAKRNFIKKFLIIKE